MSSARFPGKVLAPFKGKPLILQVLKNLQRYFSDDQIIILTSNHSSDDPLCAYLEKLGVKYFRDSLDDVFLRYKKALHALPCSWFMRICADSPLICGETAKYFSTFCQDGVDILTNVKLRTFPRGNSIEIINTDTFLKLDSSQLSPGQKEHVTSFFYDNFNLYKIINFNLRNKDLSNETLAVDTLEDLRRIESLKESIYSFNKEEIEVTS